VRIRVGEGFAGRAVNSEDAVIADDIPTDERTINPYLKEEGILAIISVRLKTLNGNAIGTLGVHSRTRTHAFRTRHADILRLLASQAVAAIANASSLEPTLRKAREATTLETLFKESVELTRPKRLPDLIHSILRTAVETLKSDGGGLYLCDTPGGDARLVEVVGLPEIERKTTTPVGTGVVGEVIRTNAPLTVSNYSSWPNRMARFDTYGFSAVAGAPIRWQDEARGAIAVHSIREGRSYSEEDLKVLSLLGAFAAVALENARRSDEYDRLFDSSLDAIVVIDDRGHVTNINPQAERVFGRPKDALLGRSVVELYANIDDPKLIKQALLRAPHGRIEDYPTSVRNLTSGVTIPISLSASLLMDDDRTVTGSVGFFRDLRELKSAQRELSLLRGVLSASRATTQISDWKRVLAVIVATVESTVGARGVVLSPCAEGQIRLAESAISPAFATSLDATTLPRQTLEQIMRAQEVIEGRGFFDGSSGSTHAGPRDIWLGCPLKIGESVLGVIVGVYDEGHAITDKERALFQLFADVAAIAINNADQASELESVAWTSALASWHASLAHDLDDEVRAIRWRLDGLQARPELPEDVKAELHRIDANAEAIALPIRRTRNRGADLLECIRREIDLARKRRPDIAWDVMPTDVSPQVVLGADWTRRIVRNFFRNAAAAMPPAWPTRRMVVTVSQNGEQAICRFEDCGRGLPVELEPIIFRRLVRHDQSMGSGLLLISSTLKQHGGSARLVSNRVGLGACFEIQIPLFGIDKRLPPRSGAQTSNPTW
jgi:PAS domain S-box-containing protein